MQQIKKILTKCYVLVVGWDGEPGDALDPVVEPIVQLAWPPDSVEQEREVEREYMRETSFVRETIPMHGKSSPNYVDGLRGGVIPRT